MSKTSMSRSQTQIATTYAPDKHFTFEGGVGACRSVPISRPDPGLQLAEKFQIRENVLEFIQNWMRRAMIRNDPPVLAQQALDENVFLDQHFNPAFDPEKFEYCKPDRLAYVPDPLLLTCRKCTIVHQPSLQDLARNEGKFNGVSPCTETADGAHEWRQVDVVFAHWSGRVDTVSPFRRNINTTTGALNMQRPGVCDAGQRCEFKLHKGRSGKFRDWYFHCHCGERRELVQKDASTLEWLVDRYASDPGETLREINMLPVSYRANSLYYVQSEQIITYDSTEHIDLMQEGRSGELLQKLLKLYNYPAMAADDETVIAELRAAGQPGALDLATTYQDSLSALESLQESGPAAAVDALKLALNGYRKTAHDKGWVVPAQTPPTELLMQVQARAGFAAPDRDLQPKGTEAERMLALEAIADAKTALGFEDLKLVRNLKMLQYSFGYSRVSPSPTTYQKHMYMPVRLCAFPKVDGNKRPIYVMRQTNEALYIKLDEAKVIEWLSANGLGDTIELEDGQKLGGKLIELYNDFGRFAEEYSETTGQRERDAPVFVFGLLHTLSHQLIHACSKFSGLDLGSFGERIFPADLAFVIYRKGMTPDLGNIAAMWRNHGLEVLGALDDARSLRCGSGSLCDHRGGACPACVMVPEVSCVAGNNILSRAILGGGPAMAWDTNSDQIKGYFEL